MSIFTTGSSHCRRAKTGRFGSLAFAMKNRHFGGECSWILAGKERKCGRFWVFACVPNPGQQSIWRQCPPSARKQSTKKLPNRPGFTHVHPPTAVSALEFRGNRMGISEGAASCNSRFVLKPDAAIAREVTISEQRHFYANKAKTEMRYLFCEGQKVPQSPKPRKIQSSEKVTKT